MLAPVGWREGRTGACDAQPRRRASGVWADGGLPWRGPRCSRHLQLVGAQGVPSESRLPGSRATARRGVLGPRPARARQSVATLEVTLLAAGGPSVTFLWRADRFRAEGHFS